LTMSKYQPVGVGGGGEEARGTNYEEGEGRPHPRSTRGKKNSTKQNLTILQLRGRERNFGKKGVAETKVAARTA